MNKFHCAFLVLFVLAFPLLSFAVTPAGSVVTNWAGLSGFHVAPGIQVSNTFTVGQIFGLSKIYQQTNIYTGYPNYTRTIPMAITNLGNDADSNTLISLILLSNNAGYSGSNWSYSIEMDGSNYGTNLALPFASFGMGAIVNFNVVVALPLVCSDGDIGFFKIDASTLSNTSHIAAPYSGMNTVAYGGAAEVSNFFRLDVDIPNSITYLEATDSWDTITNFGGTYGLRRTKHLIRVRLSNKPADMTQVKIWYALDSTADGAGGANTADISQTMTRVNDKEYIVNIQEASLGNAAVFSFLIEVDGIYYYDNYRYKIISLSSQGQYKSILMDNLLNQDGDRVGIKLPENLIGQSGVVRIYSVGGDMVKELLAGILNEAILYWDGYDRSGKKAARGMYFIMIEFDSVREVRKVFVR